MGASQKFLEKDTLIHFEEHIGDSHVDKQEGPPGRENSICSDPEI